MTPKEKAIILVHKFELLIAKSELMVYTGSSNFNQDIEDGVLEQKKVAKQCALICVYETLIAELNVIENISEYLPIDIYTQAVISHKGKSQEVKQEIEKL